MYKIKIKYNHLSIISFALGIVIANIALYLNIFGISIQLPLLLIGLFSILLIFTLVYYSMATTKQALILSFYMFCIVCLMILSVKVVSVFAHIKAFTFTSSESLLCDPFALLVSVIFSVIAFNFSFFLEKILYSKKNIEIEKEQQNDQDSGISDESPVEELLDEQPVQDLESFESTTDVLEIDDKQLEEEPSLLPSLPDIPIQDNIEPLEEVDYSNYNSEDKSFFENQLDSDSDIFEQEEGVLNDESLLAIKNLGALPEIDVNSDNTLIKKEDSSHQNESDMFYEEDDKDYSFIPDNIRLVDDLEKKPSPLVDEGIISSIGKLLINQRDVENIIEIKSVINQVGQDSDGSNVVTKLLGEQLLTKLQKISDVYFLIKDLTLANKAGFVIASLIEDSKRQYTIGALASGGFLTLQNYLLRIGVKNPEKIFFVMENSVNSLFKVDNFIFYFSCDKDFKLFEYNDLEVFMRSESVNNIELDKLKNANYNIDAVTSTLNGDFMYSLNAKNEAYSSIFSAIFENLKIFIKNIQNEKLSEIVIFSDNKIITLKKYDETILSFITDKDGPVQLTDNTKHIQNLIE